MANHERDAKRESFWPRMLKRNTARGLSFNTFCQREQLTESAFYDCRWVNAG